VDSVKYDQGAGKAEITVRNTSKKEISAFNVSITDRFANGFVDNSEISKDFLQSSIAEERTGVSPQPDYKIIGPGETRVENFLVPTRVNGEKPLSVTAIVDAVAYTDDTGEATNKAALQRMMSYRKAYGTALRDADSVIHKHLQSTNEQDFEENIRRDLTQHQANAPAIERVAYDWVLVDIANAKRTSAVEGTQRAREQLENAVKTHEHQARALRAARCLSTAH
jgi:hypothetical protein